MKNISERKEEYGLRAPRVFDGVFNTCRNLLGLRTHMGNYSSAPNLRPCMGAVYRRSHRDRVFRLCTPQVALAVSLLWASSAHAVAATFTSLPLDGLIV